ncbi:hypothetical protein PHYSODRAFT_299414 [Phytophthora sojae]|uniref:Uncharacterized protein n=1 Tax=Phytophthora sojae (strain P6497) TaxID=1094619 RepID=G4Z7R1_PHYSP|nr:hypothetical protein PHYSODRAFT_299414 [Phytophthora sojae]EGZ21815.1 hypothetical protein PHYSODRAFT_299414 [Phytophthora sojae]|eukprot:XP_009524532.1 hypothetical protein PHYSODRAFT_299414 [Phytophthora sojae]
MYDVSDVIHRLRILKERVNEEQARLSIDNPTGIEASGLRRKTILVYTEDILERYQATHPQPAPAAAAKLVTEGSTQSILPKAVHRDGKVKPKTYKRVPKHILYSPTVLSRSLKRFSLTRKVPIIFGAIDM